MQAGCEFGPFFLDPGRRILFREGEPVAITPKVFDLLAFLVENRGRVVEKEELFQAIWPDTAIEDASLSQSVFILRKALGETAKDHLFIATVPGRGYCFIAEVHERNRPAPTVPPAPRVPRKRSFAKWTIATVALGVAAALVLLVSRNRGSAVPIHAVPFTTMPGGEYEPAFSPDGNQVAFVWTNEKGNFNLYVKSMSGGAPLRITNDPAGEGSPAWSPDGGSIAFVRYSQEPHASGVYIVPALGGPERKITGLFPLTHIFDRHLDWSPDEKLLAVADKESSGKSFRIDLVSAISGERHALTHPPLQSAGDTAPCFSPDGRSVAFRRSMSSGVTDLYVVSASGGEPERVTFDNVYTSGFAWTPDGREIVFGSRRSGSSELTLWRVRASGGEPRVVQGVGEGAQFLALSRKGHHLAYSHWFADTNIWRVPLRKGSDRPADARALIASTLDERSPQYSLDGHRIAFRSDRSGGDQIWVCDSDGANALQLTSFDNVLTGTPRWSPDGNLIAFDSRPGGNPDIYVVPAAGGTVRRITANSAEDVVPSWSHDGKWIYFGSNRGGDWQIWKTPASGESAAAPAVQVTRGGGFAAFESADGKWLYYAKGSDLAGLWKVPVEGGAESLVIPGLKPGFWGYWAVTDHGIYFLDPAPGGRCAVKFFSFADSSIVEIVTLPHEPPFGDSGLAISPDENWLLYPQVDHSGSDIMLAENFR